MAKLSRFLAFSLLLTLSARGADVLFPFNNLTAQPMSNRVFTLTPKDVPKLGGGGITTSDTYQFTNNAYGYCIVSNLVDGTYLVQLTGPQTVTAFQVFVPPYIGFLNATNLLKNNTKSPGVQQITSTNGTIVVSPSYGIGSVNLEVAGGIGGNGYAPAAGTNITAITNFTTVTFSSQTDTNVVILLASNLVATSGAYIKTNAGSATNITLFFTDGNSNAWTFNGQKFTSLAYNPNTGIMSFLNTTNPSVQITGQTIMSDGSGIGTPLVINAGNGARQDSLQVFIRGAKVAWIDYQGLWHNPAYELTAGSSITEPDGNGGFLFTDPTSSKVAKLVGGVLTSDVSASTNYNATNLIGNAPASLQAFHATNADNATSASTAAQATHATNADLAVSATTATQATHATNADLATIAVTATNAQTATSATSAVNSTNFWGTIGFTNFVARFFQSNSPPMNLKRDFAAAGDGVTDDTAALQAAFNALASPSGITNGWLFIPEGRYKITSTLTIPPNTWPTSPVLSTNSGFKITGAGMHRTVLDGSGLGNVAMIQASYSSLGDEGLLFRELALKGPQNGGTSVGIGLGVGGQPFAGQLFNVMDCAIYGFGTGVACSNLWNITFDNCNISSNNLYGIHFYDTHNFLVKDCILTGCWITPSATAGGSAVGIDGPAPGVGDNGCLINCMINGWTNAILNNELNLGVENCHFEACDSYYLTTTNLSYAQVSWFGGYILEYVNRPWIKSPALMQFPRGFAQKAMILNCIIDNFATSRPYFNMVSDGSANVFPNFIHSQPVSYLVDGIGNTNTLYPINLPQTIPSTFLAPYEVANYTNWTKFNSFTGWLGVRLIPKADKILTRLGRYSLFGLNTKAHQILVLNSDYTTNGSVTLPKDSRQMDWVWARCAITLKAGTTNFIVTDAGGNTDDYAAGDSSPIYWDPDITNVFSAQVGSTTPAGFGLNATNRMYGPVNYEYSGGSGTYNFSGTMSGTFTGSGPLDLTGATNLPLSGLSQSGATLNQVPSWNGSTWVPSTVTASGGASTFGQLQSGVNFTANMIVSNGASLYPTNTGTILATWSANSTNANQATHATNADLAVSATASLQSTNLVGGGSVGNLSVTTNASWGMLSGPFSYPTTSWRSDWDAGVGTLSIGGDVSITGTQTNSAFNVAGVQTNDSSGRIYSARFLPTALSSTNAAVAKGTNGITVLTNWTVGASVYTPSLPANIGNGSFLGSSNNVYAGTFDGGALTNLNGAAIQSRTIQSNSIVLGSIDTNLFSAASMTWLTSLVSGGAQNFNQLQGGNSFGQQFIVDSGSVMKPNGSGWIQASAVTGLLTNTVANAQNATNIPSGSTIGTIKVGVSSGNTTTTLSTTNAAFQLSDLNGGQILAFAPFTNTGPISGVFYGKATNFTLGGSTVIENANMSQLNVTDFYPTNFHGVVGPTNVALNTASDGKVLTADSTALNGMSFQTAPAGFDTAFYSTASNIVVETPIWTNIHTLTSSNTLTLDTRVTVAGPTNVMMKHWDTTFYGTSFLGSNVYSITTNTGSYIQVRWSTNASGVGGPVMYLKGLTNEGASIRATAFEHWLTNGIASGGGGGSGTNLTADIWSPFEFTASAGAITISQITNDCHYAHESDLNPNVSDASSILSTSTSGEQTLTDKPQGSSDSGTRGLAINMNNTASAYVQVGLQASNTLTAGFFIKTITMASGNDGYIFYLTDSGSNPIMVVRERNNAGTHQLLLFPGNGDFQSYTITPGNTYWVMLFYTKGGTCKAGLKNPDGTWVGGSDNTFTTTDTLNLVPNRIRLGRPAGTLSADNATIYIDDMIVNWGESGGSSSVVYPFGP